MGDAAARRGPAALGLGAAMAALSLCASAIAETDAEAAFAALESRLLDAASVEVEFDIRAAGAIEVALDGQATTSSSGDSTVSAKGNFAGSEADIRLATVDGTMRGQNGDKAFELDTPPALHEGLLIGLTRMGLLHNLAVLSAGSPPDRTDGTVRDWVTVEDVVLEDSAPIGGVETRAFGFTVVVGGQPSAIARLWVDARTGLPVRRTQTVRFPEGEMRVLEQYRSFRLMREQ